MVASRRGPKGGLVTPFGLGFLTFIVVPNAIGSQDLAALVARQPVIAERPMSRFSLISTAHGATFNMPRPMSAAMPAPLSYTLAGLDTSYAGMTGRDPRAPARRGAARAGRRRIAGAEPRPKATAFRLRRASRSRERQRATKRRAEPSSDASAAPATTTSRPSNSPAPINARRRRRAERRAGDLAAPETIAPRNLSRRRTSAARPPNSPPASPSASASRAKRPTRTS